MDLDGERQLDFIAARRLLGGLEAAQVVIEFQVH